jgi:HD-like signal output (HDOD) protein
MFSAGPRTLLNGLIGARPAAVKLLVRLNFRPRRPMVCPVSMGAVPLSRVKILSLAQKLPATACVLGKLQQLLTDSNAGMDEICSLLKRDTGLAARILRISNSPYFGSATPNSSLEEAVGCVGYDEIYKVVGLTVSAHLLGKELVHYGYSAQRLWENTLGTALAMESLAQFVGVNPRAAYTAGLLRSMGKIVLELGANESSAGVTAFPASGVPVLGDWERAKWGWDSSAVTLLLLEEWNFSPETCAAMRGYLVPETTPIDEVGPSLLNRAGGVAHSLGVGLAGEESYWRQHPEAFSRTRLTDADLELCTDETKLALGDALAAFADSADVAAALEPGRAAPVT